jgi:hypothetical protein
MSGAEAEFLIASRRRYQWEQATCGNQSSSPGVMKRDFTS